MMKKQLSDPPPPRVINPAVPEDLERALRRPAAARPGGPPDRRGDLAAAGRTCGGPSAAAGPARGRGCSSAATRSSPSSPRRSPPSSRGRTGAAFVHGRSGAGKSTLLQRFLDGLVERGEAVVLGGRCYEQESVAYKAIDTPDRLADAGTSGGSTGTRPRA